MSGEQSAVLMNKREPILEIRIDSSTIMSTGNILNADLMPIQLQNGFTITSINQWFTGRMMPEKREGLAEARMLFRGFEREKYFFSLSDQYWVKYSRSDTWDKYNFFTNSYNKEVGKIFFEPWNVDRKKIPAPSPDRTTNGVLRKRWVQEEDGTSWLIKQGSVLYHQEPLSEVMASMMLKQLDILPFVEYEMIIDGLRFCSRCPNFVTADTEFVPAIAIYNLEKRKKETSEYEHFLAMCKKFGISGVKDFLDRMITADHILCNNDRHFGNFGFLRSAETGKILGFAPLFDCGSAYWGTSKKAEIRKSRYFAKEEMEILNRSWNQGLLKNAKAGGPMVGLLREYPDISAKKKNDIEKMIGEVDLELEQLTGSRGEGKRRVSAGPKENMLDIDFG